MYQHHVTSWYFVWTKLFYEKGGGETRIGNVRGMKRGVIAHSTAASYKSLAPPATVAGVLEIYGTYIVFQHLFWQEIFWIHLPLFSQPCYNSF